MNESEISQEFNRQACFLLRQSLKKIEHCLRQIDFDQCWWRPRPGLSSIGNLLLHVNGNLRQWAISGLTGTSDKRNRDAEFESDRERSIDDLLELTRNTINEACFVIEKVQPQDLIAPINIQGFEVTWLQAIVHTTAHYQGHTHQIIMLTRMQLGDDYQFEWTPDLPRGELPM